MRDFTDFLPEPQLTSWLTYLRDRMKSSHRKPQVTVYVWDKLATTNGINGGWINLSHYGFEASLKYADVFSGGASTCTISAVDPSKVQYNPFFGIYKYLFERGNKVKVVIEERDLPIKNVLIPLFTGEILDVNYKLSRASKKSEWEVDCQVLNFQKIWKKKITSKAWYPPFTQNFLDYKLTQTALAGQKELIMNEAELRANYLNGQEIWLSSPTDPPGTAKEKYTVLRVRPTTPGGGFGTLEIVGYLKKDYPLDTTVEHGFAKSAEEADTGYIARELLKIMNYHSLMGLDEDDLLRDIPNTGYRIQNKTQFQSMELGEILYKLLTPGGCMPWIRPYDGRIVSLPVHQNIKNLRDSDPLTLPNYKRLGSEVVSSLTFASDSGAICNQYEVVGLSPDTTINVKDAKKLFTTSGNIAWWTNSSLHDYGPFLPGYQYRDGKEYLSWTVFGSEDHRMRIRKWFLNKQGTHRPDNWFMWTEFAILPHDEFECELRLYFDNWLRVLIGIVTGALVVVGFIVGFIVIVQLFFIVIKWVMAAAVATPGSAVAAADATEKTLTTLSSFFSLMSMITSIMTTLFVMSSVADYAVQVDGHPYEEYYQEIGSKASMPFDVIAREGEHLEREENHIISTVAKAHEVATLMLLIKRSEMTKVKFTQIYDYELEPGDIVEIETYNESDDIITQFFIVRDITFGLDRGGPVTASYSLTYLDPAIELQDITAMVNPEIVVEQAFGYDFNGPGGGDPVPGPDYPHNGGLRTKDVAVNGNPNSSTGPGPEDEFGNGNIPLVLNHDPIDKNGEYQTWRKSTHRHEIIRVRIKNHASELVPYIAVGKKYRYVYAYSTVKSELENSEKNDTTNFDIPGEGDDFAKLIRAATPGPQVFNDTEIQNMTFGLGHPREHRPDDLDNPFMAPIFTGAATFDNALIIGEGPSYIDGDAVFDPLAGSNEVIHADDSAATFFSNILDPLFGVPASGGVPGPIHTHDGLRRFEGNPLPFSTSGIMWWEPVPTDVDEELLRYFYVALPLPFNQDVQYRRIFIRVGIVEVVEDQNGDPEFEWGTLQLSNSFQVIVHGVRK